MAYAVDYESKGWLRWLTGRPAPARPRQTERQTERPKRREASPAPREYYALPPGGPVPRSTPPRKGQKAPRPGY